MQETGSNVDGLGSLLLNLSSVPFTGRLGPGCGPGRGSLARDHSGLCNVRQPVQRTDQVVLVRVEEVVQVVDGHHQVVLVDQAGGCHAVVSGRALSICTNS